LFLGIPSLRLGRAFRCYLFAQRKSLPDAKRISASIPNVGVTFCGLAKVAIFTTNIDAENQTLINHKSVCGALNRHFCQAPM
jgi:hypothetical protein